MTTLVWQRQRADCAICCLAMLTGRTWEEVRTAIGDAWHPRRGLIHSESAMERLGFAWGLGSTRPNGYVVVVDARALISPPLLWGRRALLSVPSLNRKGWHMVYWDGAKLLDPSLGRRNEDFFELTPREVYIFREAGA